MTRSVSRFFFHPLYKLFSNRPRAHARLDCFTIYCYYIIYVYINARASSSQLGVKIYHIPRLDSTIVIKRRRIRRR